MIKYVLFQKFELSTSLDNLHFILLILATLFIAIAGYIINDVQDIEADKINKPSKVFVGKKIPIAKANNLFIAINSVGLLLGFYLSIYIDKNSFFIIFILVSFLLYRYAIDLKKRLIIGNITVACIVFLSIMIVGFFDIVPVTNNYNKSIQFHVFKILLIISGFAFMLTLLREIIKDLEDKKGDQKINAKTMPIVFGDKKTKHILVFLNIIPLIGISYIIYSLYKINLYTSLYLIIFVSLPLLYFMFKTTQSKTKKDFQKTSNLLKFIMLLGILSIFTL
ncbi:MAG: geranylgeranylglycerol-phosphate geranylgeranyltransferase [Flavobacteriaceae bacterium]|nr:geranylgeranylglycerol-phosphate geranylgeranyltransferase [Flavobacteriaceae bacterium]